MSLSGVGLGFRPALGGALLASPEAVDFVEVVAETCRFGDGRKEARAITSLWPVVPHGVKLGLGGAEGVDRDRARELGALARELRAPCVSEHVAFVRGGGREIGHLTELPFTREAVRVVARNVDALRRHLPDVPLLLENVARAFLWRDAEMSEGDFYAEVARATGCSLLLDVGNLYANAVNEGADPAAVLDAFPLDAVAMLHVAGGAWDGGFYFDTHAHPIPAAVLALVERACAARPGVPILLERDAGIDDPADVLAEVAALRLVAARHARAPTSWPAVAGAAPTTEPHADGDALARAQARFASLLVDTPPPTDTQPGDPPRESVTRARRVLERKRADDALPLLAGLSGRLTGPEALALGALATAPRPPSMAAVADALRIARGAMAVPALARIAREDELVLRARFVERAAPRPRSLPFVGRAALPDGGSAWAFKAPGVSAPVKLWRRAPHRRVDRGSSAPGQEQR